VLRGTALVVGGGALSALLAACGANATPTVSATATRASQASAAASAASGGGATASAAPASASSAAVASSAAASAAASTGGGKTIPELRVAVAGFPDSMDPHESISNVGMRIHYFTFDTLIRRDFFDGNTLIPSLATEWKRIDDKTLEMTLRRDVVWQDGTPFTSADVKYNYDRIIGKDPKLEVASPGYFPLASVEALDDYRVRFVTSAIDPVLEKRFAGLGGQIIPAKYHKEVGTDPFRTKPLGTGPYRMLEYVKDERMVFEANEKYFGGAPAAKKVTIRLIPETAARMAALQNGEVDIVTNVPPDQIASLQADKNLVIKQVPLANVHVLRYNMKAKPFDKKAIRQAVNHAIDRKTLVEQLWGGNAIHTRGFQYEGEEFYNPSRPLTAYDPEKAKALLKEGGYANEPIVAMMQQVGINAKLELLEGAAKDKAYREDNRQITTWSATSGTGDPDGYLWRNWGPDNAQQKNGWWAAESAAKYNQLGAEARSILDKQKRFELYQQMLDVYEDEAPGTVLYIPKEVYGTRAAIDWTPYPLYYMDLRNYNFKVK
jgi:peptide/nickel transport system substrate-binding protein